MRKEKLKTRVARSKESMEGDDLNHKLDMSFYLRIPQERAFIGSIKASFNRSWYLHSIDILEKKRSST